MSDNQKLRQSVYMTCQHDFRCPMKTEEDTVLLLPLTVLLQC